MHTKEMLKDLFWHFAGVAFSFGLIYWLATDNLWLCFFLANALSGGQFLIRYVKRDLLEIFVPVHQSIDDNINSLHGKSQLHEQELEDLKDKLRELEAKFDELNEQVNPSRY